ncbi:MAG: hypothetical protein LUQ66_04090 [Methanoregula sp.]|nr:hypothetical protein [Methanoregula sp.]
MVRSGSASTSRSDREDSILTFRNVRPRVDLSSCWLTFCHEGAIMPMVW